MSFTLELILEVFIWQDLHETTHLPFLKIVAEMTINSAVEFDCDFYLLNEYKTINRIKGRPEINIIDWFWIQNSVMGLKPTVRTGFTKIMNSLLCSFC